MAGIHLHRSNRLEALADALAVVTAVPPGDAFVAETVVVQSLGMRRWIALELARRTGVAMNVRFPFPAEFANDVLKAAIRDEPATEPFSRDVLPWRILGLFPRQLSRSGFEVLRAYTSGEPRALKEFQLAQKIARLFDRYVAYRPEWLLDWQGGRDSHWQAQLWRELVRGYEKTNPPVLSRRLVEQLRGGSVIENGLPSRVSIFGISSLPPIYLELLNVVATSTEVHLFLLEPTADYWADLLTPREREREARRRRLHDLPEDVEPELGGNSLLASLCKTGRDFSWLLLDRLEAANETEGFVLPVGDTLLGQLQADLYHLREPEERRAIAPGDNSLQVHCCHGPMRELEILHDQLLSLFAAHPDLAPRDVLVTMPDVETYASYIDAVFGAPESEALRIPYTIADRAARAENSIAAALLQVLDLVGSRFTAPSVLSLLDTPAIRMRFGLGESDLPLVRDWVERSGIRWGIDADHRAGLDLPAFAENTWRGGLDRLLLGYALPGDGTTLFAGVLPEPGIEGQMALTLGQFVDFAENIFTHCEGLARPRPSAGWERALRALLDDLFDDADEFADERRRVSHVLEQLRDHTAVAGLETPLEFSVIRAHLSAALADDASSSGFLAGRVTFCALKPMRSIPFRVICMIGLDDIAFPRRDRPLSFDLMAQKPRRGDRSTRDDDRYLFLESLFSARETLYLSYCGLSPRDNSESPPSVIVAELLDYLARRFDLPLDFVLKHRLQPFSPAYFAGNDPRLFSYSSDNAAAAFQSANERQTAPPFALQRLPEPESEWRAVSLEQLADFLTKPARYFLKNRLRLRLPDREQPPADREPTGLDGLTRHQLREVVTRRSMESRQLTADLATARATGALAPGYAGASDYGMLTREVEQLLARIGTALDSPPIAPLRISFEADGWQFAGTLADVRPDGLVRFRAAKQKATDQLHAWIAHLALQLSDAPVRTTTFHSLDATVRFQPVEDAKTQLTNLLRLYARGLSEPLPLFPSSSLDFTERHLGLTGRSDPLHGARATFEKYESEDEWTKFAFRGVDDPLDGEFADLSLQIWKPLIEAKGGAK